MADTLESLELEVKHSASGAGEEINKLSSAISALKSSLSGVPTLMKDFTSAINGLKDGAASKIKSLAEALDALGNSASTFVGFISLESLAKVLTDLGNAQVNGSMLATLARGLDKLSESIKKLNGVHTYDLNIVANALAALGGIDFSGLASLSFAKLANGIASLAIAATSITQEAVDGLRGIATALGVLAGVDFVGLANASFTKLSNGIARLATALKQLTPDDIAKFRNLSSALNGLNLSNLGDAGNLTGVVQAAKAMHSTAKGVRKVGDEAKKAKGPIATFLASIKRIAFYRMLRTIIKEIGQAFSEGLKSAYLFSAGLTTISGHRFAKAMDEMNSRATQMKAQLGSAFISLLTALEPIINRIIELAIQAADAISQFLAALTGSTYLKAAKVTDSLVDDFKSGASAAKEWKNQILGFDVINRLNKDGTTGLSPSELFGGDESPIEQKWLDLADAFTEFTSSLNFNVSDILFNWGELTGEDIASKVIAGLGALVGLSVGFLIGGVPGAVVGTIVGASIGIVFSNLLFNHDGVLERYEVLSMLCTVLGALVGGLLGFVVGGPVGAAIGVIVGAGIGLLVPSLIFKQTGNGRDTALRTLIIVLGAICGGLIGFAIGGPLGAVIGVTVGAGVGLLVAKAMFKNGSASQRALTDSIVGVLGAIAGGIIGFAIGGPAGALIGAAVGAGISLVLADCLFSGTGNESTRDSMLKGLIAILSVLAMGAIGFALGGPLGAVIGITLAVGVTLLANSVTWDDASQSMIKRETGNIFSDYATSNAANVNASVNYSNSYGSDPYSWMKTIPGMASGGYPDVGLFYAYENGPEMVGTVNGRTAVATNDDIVAAVSSGVANAVSGVMGTGNKNISVHVYLDSREIKSGQQRLARATGV